MYKVLASKYEDMNQGWVWIKGGKFPPRSIIKVTNNKNNKSIFCEYLEIDTNFINKYNQPGRLSIDSNENTIVLNAWYRNKLGAIETKINHDLQIKESNNWNGKFHASIQHPQVIVRLATHLASISIMLGLLSIFLTFK